MVTPPTPKEFLALLQKHDFYIGDGLGDHCSGYDDEGMLEEAKTILEELKEKYNAFPQEKQ